MGQTSYKKLTLPTYAEANWFEAINSNFVTIDRELQVLNANVTNQISSGSVNIITGDSFDQCMGTHSFDADHRDITFEFVINNAYAADIISSLYCETSWMMTENNGVTMIPCLVDYSVDSAIKKESDTKLEITVTVNSLPASGTLKCILKAFLPHVEE